MNEQQNEYGTPTDTLAPGRFGLVGQQIPEYLIDLAWGVIEANKLSKAASDNLDRHETPEALQEMVDAETLAQSMEALYLEQLSDYRSRQQWGAENAHEQQAEYFVEG